MYRAVVVQEILPKRWEPWRWEVQWTAIRSWQQPSERIIKADLLTTTWEVAEDFIIDHSMVIWHLKQIGKVKKFDKWVPYELTEKKNHYCTTTNHVLIGLWCSMQRGFYMTTGNIKPNLHQKQIVVPVCCAGLIHNSFLNPRETSTSKKYAQKIDEMHFICSQRWSTQRAQFFNRTMPNHTLYNQHFKSWTNWATNFASYAIVTWPVTT